MNNQERKFKEILASWRALLILWIPIILISVAHYSTSGTFMWLHDIFRRLYYIPIILGAFTYGKRGALSASVVASLLYMPHAFLHITHIDPARSIEKILEIFL